MPAVLSPSAAPKRAASLRTLWRLLFFLLAAAGLALSTRIAEPIVTSPEMFHEGEYVGNLWHMKAWKADKAPFPLLIHGALDYVPSQIAHAIYGGSRVIGGTRVINTLIVVLAWVLFIELVFQMGNPAWPSRWRIIVAVGLFALLSPPWFPMPLQVSEAFVGVRDLFLLGILLAFLSYWRSSGIKAAVLGAVGAAVLPMAIPWSYDRGLIAIGFTGLMLGAMALHRRWTDLFSAAGALTVMAIILERSRIFGPLAENFQNIFYWIRQSGAVWGLPFQFPEPGSVLGLLLVFLCLMVAAMTLRELRSRQSRESCWMLLGLVLVQLLLAKSSLNRPAENRVLMALFPSILLMVHFGTRLLPGAAPQQVDPPAPRPIISSRLPLFMFGVSASLFLMIVAGILLPLRKFSTAAQTFFQTMARPRSDLKMVPAEAAELALALRQSPQPALFGWCNEGVIHLLARKRWATRFPYAIYAGPAHEAKLLAELQALNLEEILSRPEAWSMQIDGRSMTQRLPAVDEYIRSHFSNPIQFGSYVLLRPPSPTPPAAP